MNVDCVFVCRWIRLEKEQRRKPEGWHLVYSRSADIALVTDSCHVRSDNIVGPQSRSEGDGNTEGGLAKGELSCMLCFISIIQINCSSPLNTLKEMLNINSGRGIGCDRAGGWRWGGGKDKSWGRSWASQSELISLGISHFEYLPKQQPVKIKYEDNYQGLQITFLDWLLKCTVENLISAVSGSPLRHNSTSSMPSLASEWSPPPL